MKTKLHPCRSRPGVRLARWTTFTVLLLAPFLWRTAAGEPPPLEENEFRARVNELKSVRTDADRIQRARVRVLPRKVSSQQVKQLAQTIGSEDARIEFVLSAYPFTVDPENFYEVYDAFQTFSKVFRLHDRIAQLRPPPAPPVVAAALPSLSETELKGILDAVRNEPFDAGKLTVGRQVVTSARGRISSQQIGGILKLFAFEDGRLELAKAAYECAADPWNYHVVYGTFAFPGNRELLARFVESHARPPRPGQEQ